MEGAFEDQTGKLGLGVLRYGKNKVVCVIDKRHAGESLQDLYGIPHKAPIVASADEARRHGAEALVLGIAPPGGLVPGSWLPTLDRAVSLGLSLVNGLHDKLAPRYPRLAHGQFVWDVRTEPHGLGVGQGLARLQSNRRVLMVGTDMSVGKMTAGLELVKSADRSGLSAGFVATGQTGIIIEGRGVPLDAVRLDYASGAVESEVLSHAGNDLVVIEGQGSLLHPGSSATLPLMRGSCPTHLVLCHRAGMKTLSKIEWVTIPELLEVAKLFEDVASALGTFPAAKVVGVALNTSHLGPDEAADAIDECEKAIALPTCDPVRDGAEKLLSAVMA